VRRRPYTRLFSRASSFLRGQIRNLGRTVLASNTLCGFRSRWIHLGCGRVDGPRHRLASCAASCGVSGAASCLANCPGAKLKREEGQSLYVPTSWICTTLGSVACDASPRAEALQVFQPIWLPPLIIFRATVRPASGDEPGKQSPCCPRRAPTTRHNGTSGKFVGTGALLGTVLSEPAAGAVKAPVSRAAKVGN